MSKVVWNKPVYNMSQSGNSSGYEKTLCENSIQVTELHFYINNFVRCLVIVDLLYARIQDHQLNTFTSFILSYKSIIYK